jgi:hypothetical protein
LTFVPSFLFLLPAGPLLLTSTAIFALFPAAPQHHRRLYFSLQATPPPHNTPAAIIFYLPHRLPPHNTIVDSVFLLLTILPPPNTTTDNLCFLPASTPLLRPTTPQHLFLCFFHLPFALVPCDYYNTT